MIYKKILRNFLLLFTAICATQMGNAQVLNGSPYSNYGLGDLHSFGSTTTASAGYIGTSFARGNDFSFTNAASLGYVNRAIIKIGAVLKNVHQETETLSQKYTEGDLSYVAIGFPIADRGIALRKYLDSTGKIVHEVTPIKAGLSFGMAPFSTVAYGTSYTVDSSFGSYSNIFNGEGGLSKVFVSTGIKIGNSFSIGYSGKYIFGSLNDYRIVLFPDSVHIKGEQDHRRTSVKGFQQTLGLQFNKEIGKNRHIIGATYTFNAKMHSVRDRVVMSMNNYGSSLRAEDTLFYESGAKSSFDLPSGFTVGYSFQHGDKWMAAAEVKRENWESFSWANSNDLFANSTEYSLGFVLNPNRFEKTEYGSGKKFLMPEIRIGARFKESYLKFEEVNGDFSQLTETGITFGLGIPMVSKYYNTSDRIKHVFDIGFEYYVRGKKDAGLVKEHYFNVTLGLTFTDIWFKKRKIY